MAGKSETIRSTLTPFYSSFYFLHYAFYSFPMAILPLYLNSISFSAFEIAMVSAVFNLAIVLGSILSLQLAARHFSSYRLNNFCTISCLLSFMLLFGVQSFSAVCAVVFLFMTIFRCSGSLIDARAVRHSAAGVIVFEYQRVWGAFGFIFSVYLFGRMADGVGVEQTMWLAAVFLFLLVVLAPFLRSLFASFEISSESRQTHHSFHPRWKFAISMFLLSSALVWMSHSVLTAFLSVYLEALGWTATEISYAFTVGVFAEAAFYILFPKLEQRFSLISILRFSALMCVLRWAILGVSADSMAIYGSQLLHAFTFGTFYIAGAKFVFEVLPDEFRDRGQGWFIAAGSGLGALAGRLLAGYWASMLDSYIELRVLFLASAFIAAAALLLVLCIPKKHESEFTHPLE